MSDPGAIKLVECPRDAIQGIKHFIPTERKIAYINQLLASNLFEYIDFGSFVSPRAVPQMADTAAVTEGVDKINKTKLLAIVANERGAELGVQFDKIDYLGYPFSISEIFQQRNANSSVEESFRRVVNIQQILKGSKQQLVLYISMAFGNPYGDGWSQDILLSWLGKLADLGIARFSLADTTSEASPSQIREVVSLVKKDFAGLDLSLHLHSRVENAQLKIDAAYEAGCRRFEGAFLGYGGCPFAQDDLVGNIPTELLLDKFERGKPVEILNLLTGFQQMIRRDAV